MKRIRLGGGIYVPPKGDQPAMIVSKSGHVTVHTAAKAKCELCGALAELRPYGPGGKYICFACMMKEEAQARARFYRQFDL